MIDCVLWRKYYVKIVWKFAREKFIQREKVTEEATKKKHKQKISILV